MFHRLLTWTPRVDVLAQVVLPCVTGTLLAACGGEPPVEPELARVESAIAGGEVDEEGKWTSVVRLRATMSGHTQTCTGTLVAPNLVITALHCVAPMQDANFQCNSDGSVTQTKPGAGEIGQPIAAENVEVHVGLDAGTNEPTARGKSLITTKSQNICTNDLAFIVLDTELDLPLSRLRLEEPVILGERLTIVGYGATGVSGDQVTRRFKDDVRVTDIGADTGMDTNGTAPPRTLVVGPSACKGDSGGPAFAVGVDGQPVIAGVDSIIIGACGSSTSFSIFTRLAPFDKLTMEAFEAAGHPAWLEGQIAPGIDPVVTVPDGGVDTSDEQQTTDAPPPAKAQRLKTGCSISGTQSQVSLRALGWLCLAIAVAEWRRRPRAVSR